MGYVGSYVWGLRQKLGNTTVMTATVDVLPVDSRGRVKLVFIRRIGKWSHAGGHAELGDSWAGAAVKELLEETGIVARKEDLEVFATMSGPGRIYRYEDGSSQAFTLVYLVRKWESEREPTDVDEIAETKWFSLEEARGLDLEAHAVMVLDAYEEFLETGKVVAIEEEKESNIGENR